MTDYYILNDAGEPVPELDLLQDPAIRAQVHRLLVGAREVIAAPERFTRGWSARTPLWDECSVNDPMASSWCSIGALYLICRKEKIPGVAFMVAEKLLRQRAGASAEVICFASLSDSLPHAEVLAIFDAAIAETAP